MNNIHNDDDSVPGAGQALEKVFELAVVAFEFMERGLADRGLTRARVSVLWNLRVRGPVTQRELAEAIRVTPRNVTGLVDALEGDGFVVRERHPTDRRATLVTLTDKGSAAVAGLDGEFREGSGRLFDGLPDGALEGFLLTAEQLIARIRQETC